MSVIIGRALPVSGWTEACSQACQHATELRNTLVAHKRVLVSLVT